MEVDSDRCITLDPALAPPAAVKFTLLSFVWLVLAHPFTDELVQFLSGFRRDCLCLHQVHAQDMCGFRSRVDWVHPAEHHAVPKDQFVCPDCSSNVLR